MSYVQVPLRRALGATGSTPYHDQNGAAVYCTAAGCWGPGQALMTCGADKVCFPKLNLALLTTPPPVHAAVHAIVLPTAKPPAPPAVHAIVLPTAKPPTTAAVHAITLPGVISTTPAAAAAPVGPLPVVVQASMLGGQSKLLLYGGVATAVVLLAVVLGRRRS